MLVLKHPSAAEADPQFSAYGTIKIVPFQNSAMNAALIEFFRSL